MIIRLNEGVGSGITLPSYKRISGVETIAEGEEGCIRAYDSPEGKFIEVELLKGGYGRYVSIFQLRGTIVDQEKRFTGRSRWGLGLVSSHDSHVAYFDDKREMVRNFDRIVRYINNNFQYDLDSYSSTRMLFDRKIIPSILNNFFSEYEDVQVR